MEKKCVIEYPTNRNPPQSLQENAITVFPTLKKVRTKKFKFELEKFLELFLNESKMLN